MRTAASLFLLAACSSTEPMPPSVLLITLDTTRADRLGPYGYDGADTPTYDAFAADGAVFVRAYSSCPLTIPSHSTILTGRYPPSHGVRDNGAFVLGEDAVLLSERFHDAGWATAAFTAAFPTQRRWGFDQGFDVYSDPLERLPTQLDWRDERTADQVVDDAIDTLSGFDDKPWFVWVHLFDAHWPYEPPEPFKSAHELPYDGEVSFADHEVGRLLTWWDERRPESWVTITADHGEGFGDGGEMTHGFLLHDGTAHVPLMVRGPGVEAGLRVDDPVGTVDIAPTLLALAGLDVHDGVQGHDLFDGGSDEVYAEALTGQYNLGLSPLFSLTGPDGRYMEGAWGGWYPATGQVVSADPAEGYDVNALAIELARRRATLDEVIAPTTALDATALEALMALGYMGGDPTTAAGEIDPRDVIDIIPLTWQARQAIGMGRIEVADRLIGRLEARMPDTFGVDTLRAQLLRRQGKLDEAIEKFTDLYLRSPGGTVVLQLANLHAVLGEWDEARDWYAEALELQPNSPEAMGGLVRAARALGQDALAEEWAGQFLLQYPDHAELMLILAEIQIDDGRADLAVQTADAALERMPAAAWAHAVSARALWEAGDPDPAIERLQDALRLDPFDIAVRWRLTECLLEVRRNAEAVRTIAPIARLYPENEAVVGLHGRAVAALEDERGG